MKHISNFARNVRAYRKLHNWTLRDIENKTGIDSGNLSRLERGEMGPSATSVSELCKVFGISEGMLFSDENPADNRMLEFRRIPILDSTLIPAYAIDHQIVEVPEYLRYIAVEKSSSFHSFGFVPDPASLRPAFEEGDVVVIDPAVKPLPGDFVLAVIPNSTVLFSRYKVTSESKDGKEAFDLVPLNDFYPVVNSSQEGVSVVGTMVERRSYRRKR